GGDPVDDHLEDYPPVTVGAAPVAAEEALDPGEVLDVDRPVEPELVGDPVEILGAHGGAERVDGSRAARRQMEEGEPGERHQAQHHHRLDHPPREVLSHRRAEAGAANAPDRAERPSIRPSTPTRACSSCSSAYCCWGCS